MNYLKKNIIRNVKKNDVKSYINRIISLNKDIEIFKINYNEINKTLIVIANKRVQLKQTINKNIICFKTIDDIKSEINRLSNQKEILDGEYINLENIRVVYDNIINNLYIINNKLENDMERKLQYLYGNNYGIVIYNYNSDNNTIKIGFSKDYNLRKYKSIVFSKNNNKINILNSDNKEYDNILKIINDDLNELFNNFKKYRLLDNEYIENLRSVNANFYVDISLYSIVIKSKYNDKIYFKINYDTYDSNFYIDCDDIEIKNYLNDIAPILLNLIYIPIVECPTWSQDKLYNIRDMELNNVKVYKIKRYSK